MRRCLVSRRKLSPANPDFPENFRDSGHPWGVRLVNCNSWKI